MAWAEHLRVLAGPDADSIEPIDPADHPLLEPPMPVDCAVDDPFDLALEPYPDAIGRVIGGTIMLFDQTPLRELETDDDTDSEEAEEPEEPRRFMTLDGATWTEGSAEGVPAPRCRSSSTANSPSPRGPAAATSPR